MPDQARTDAALLDLFTKGGDLSTLAPEEQLRLIALTDDAGPKEGGAAAADFATTNERDDKGAPVVRGSYADLLPDAGGMIGSLVGGRLGPVAGALAAGVGGAAGKGYQELIKRGGELPGAIKDIAGNLLSQPRATLGGFIEGAKQGGTEALTEGGKQAAMELGGRGVGAGLKAGAKGLKTLALRPTRAVAKDLGGGSVLKGYDRLATQALDDKVLPSRMGLSKIENLAKQSGAEAAQIASASPEKEYSKRILDQANADQAAQMLEKMRSGVRPNAAPMRAQLDLTAQMMNPTRSPGSHQVGMYDLHKLKQKWDVTSDAAHAAASNLKADVPIGSEGSVAKSMADAARTKLNYTLPPAYRQANRATQTRNALATAIEDAATRPNMLQNALAIGGGGLAGAASGDPMEGLEKAALIKLLTTPTGLGLSAHGLNQAARLPYSQLFRAGHAATQLPQEEPEE